MEYLSAILARMKLFIFYSLLFQLLLKEASCTHLETCECHEIKAIVSDAVEQAMARLEYNLTREINKAITRINTTDLDLLSRLETGLNLTQTRVLDLENDMKNTMVQLIDPIQAQLDYHLPLGPPGSQKNPAESCKEIFKENNRTSSGYYWIKTTNCPIKVYCKMDSSCGNMTGGWMRVAYLDMTNTSHHCPSALTLLSRSSTPRRLCDTSHTGCASTSYTVYGKEYSHIFGKIIAYHKDELAAFWYNYCTIDQTYVYGVSLTHGQSPRKHIWTFAGAVDETSSRSRYKCPCINTNIQETITIPSFVGNDYFCDTGFSYLYSYSSSYSGDIQPSDPLWDGNGCGSSSTCCSVQNECGNSPPWFIKHLQSPTTDSVELRLCKPWSVGTTPIEIIELYVQ